MIEDIDVILRNGESYTVEFKESADKSLPSEICAFANASGERVFIGVDDNGVVVGTDVSNAVRSRIQDTINQIKPRLNVDIEIMDNIIEQMGTGIMRMKNAAKEAKVSAPEFELSGFFKVTFKRNIASISNIAQLSATSDKQAIGKRLISDCQAIETSDRKSEILAYIEEHKRATASEASGLLGLSKARVRAILREMVSDGTIEKVGDNRYAYYVRR